MKTKLEVKLLEVIAALLDEHSDCKGCESSTLALKAIAEANKNENG